MTTTEIFLIAMVIIFTVPYLIWRLGRTDYWAPLVVVQIITGILLGPGILGAAFPDYYQFVFNPDVIKSLNGIAWWAVMIFVWIAGIELDLKKAWEYTGNHPPRKRVAPIALIKIMLAYSPKKKSANVMDEYSTL